MKLPLSRAFFPFKTSIAFVLVLLLLLSAFPLAAIAQEVIASYPFLPSGRTARAPETRPWRDNRLRSPGALRRSPIGGTLRRVRLVW